MSVSLISQRVFHGTTDISTAVGDFRVGTYALTYTAGQYIYIGATSPFNNIWMEMTTVAGASAGAPTVELWWGNDWISAVDVIDQTAGMTVSNRISWATPYLKGWDLEQFSTTVGLTGTNIFDRYWLRLSWASNFTAGVAYMGQKFSTDTIFASYYPDLMQTGILTGYKAAKTNWDEQHFMASENILRDLRKRAIIKERGQVFDWQGFEETSCHKAAEIIYQAFGAPYRDHVIAARQRYEEDINRKALNIDSNMNGQVDQIERQDNQGWMTR